MYPMLDDIESRPLRLLIAQDILYRRVAIYIAIRGIYILSDSESECSSNGHSNARGMHERLDNLDNHVLKSPE
jgi:hypothetical protein